MKLNVGITDQKINIQEAYQFVQDPACGAFDIFIGSVRNHDHGKQVTSLSYEAYKEMCDVLLEKFAQEALARFQIQKIYCHHRVGLLEIGEESIIIASSAHHRDAAFKATRFMIEKIKLDLPVWKKENYIGHPSEWLKACSHSTFNWEALEK